MKGLVKLLVALGGVVVILAGAGLVYLYTRYPAVPAPEDVHIQATPERLARGQYLVENVGCMRRTSRRAGWATGPMGNCSGPSPPASAVTARRFFR